MVNVKLYSVSVGPVAIALAIRSKAKPAAKLYAGPFGAFEFEAPPAAPSAPRTLYVGSFCQWCGASGVNRRFCPQCGAATGRV